MFHLLATQRAGIIRNSSFMSRHFESSTITKRTPFLCQSPLVATSTFATDGFVSSPQENLIIIQVYSQVSVVATTVEVDPSDLEYEMYYKDNKCQELETILRSNSRYAEYMVKRVHWTDDGTDPFDVLDANEESIVLLETWEVNTLGDSEILS